MSEYHDHKVLLAGIHGGEERAVRHLFHLYYTSLRYFAAGIVEDIQEAEDIAIQVFQKFIERKAGFGSVPAIRSFLFTSVKNACIDHLRKERIRLKRREEIAYLAPSQDDPLEEGMLRAKVIQLVYEEVERLPTQCRTIFKAYFLEGKDTASIAAELDLSPQTVLNQKSRAIQHLRSFVRKEGVFPLVLFFLPGLFR